MQVDGGFRHQRWRVRGGNHNEMRALRCRASIQREADLEVPPKGRENPGNFPLTELFWKNINEFSSLHPNKVALTL